MKPLGFATRFIVFIATLAVAIVFLIHLRVWSADWTSYLFMTDKWLELVFVLAVVYLFSTIIVKLLQWAARKEL